MNPSRAALLSILDGWVDRVTHKTRQGSPLYRLCLRIIDRVNGENNSNLHTNGESAFLKRSLRDGDVVFDIGAHIGEWARACLSANPRVDLHCFEPSRFTFHELEKAGLPSNVHLNNFGLSSAGGPATLRIVAEGHPMNSLYLRQGVSGMSWESRTEQVDLRTLDDYCAQHKIPRVDLIKVDVEGHELEALKGAARMLAQNRIGLIQFEYGQATMDARVFLIDIFAFLLKLCPRTRFGKILPQELLEIPRYDRCLETFRYANYLASLTREPSLHPCGELPATPADSLKSWCRNLPVFYRTNHYAKRWLQTNRARREDLRWRLKWDGRPSPSPEHIAAILPKPKGSPQILYVGFGEKSELGHENQLAIRYTGPNVLSELKHFGRVETFMVPHPGHHLLEFWKAERPRINEDLLKFAEGLPRKPDILIGQMSGWFMEPSTLQRLRAMGIPLINYSWDDTVGFYGKKITGVWSGPAALASTVDLNLTSSKKSCLKYEAEGGRSFFWPEAANPKIHRPYEVPFEYDVSFVGGRYGYRPLLIGFLRRHGVNVVAFGPGWKGGVLPTNEVVALFSRSRINLGFGGIGHMVKVQHLKGRDFEIPMSGGLYLTSYNPELEECYEIGKEIVCYRDKWDCLEKIRHLLKNPDQAKAIREAGRRRALHDHTWEQRFTQLFHLIGLL